MAESLRDIVEATLFTIGSSREFEREAMRRGHNLTHTTINQIRNGTHGGTFRPATLDAIAAVSGVSRRRVYAAADLPLRPRR